MNVNEETPTPTWVKFESLEAFLAAKEAIENWYAQQPKEVVKLGNAVEPDLTKPYTEYDDENLRIWTDANVMELL
jgi:hypothetical protein